MALGDPIQVLVVFYSRFGRTEKLALAAAVGAVQARANIRLRRLPDVVEAPEREEEVARMKKEYVTPAESDLRWADAIIFLLPPELDTSSGECAAYLDLLRRLKIPGSPSPIRLAGTDHAMRHGRDVAMRVSPP